MRPTSHRIWLLTERSFSRYLAFFELNPFHTIKFISVGATAFRACRWHFLNALQRLTFLF